jgi:hypothetical protein
VCFVIYKFKYLYCIIIIPTHKGKHEVMRIQTIIMRTRTHSMQAISNLLRGSHIPQARSTRPRLATQVGARIPITTPPPWGEQLPHGTHGRTPLQASPTMPYTSGSFPGTTPHTCLFYASAITLGRNEARKSGCASAEAGRSGRMDTYIDTVSPYMK